MGKLLGWAGVTVLVASGLWDLSRTDPAVAPAVTAVILLVLGLLVGLRIGSDSSSAYAKDLLRVNKYLSDQNDQLTELNHSHIKRQLGQDFDDQGSSISAESENDT